MPSLKLEKILKLYYFLLTFNLFLDMDYFDKNNLNISQIQLIIFTYCRLSIKSI